ncbi:MULTISPECIES: hypothetical protein [Halomonadaceae]|uniref:Uncharacterized protein n=1 Tax=Vreelandella titanicae TaxID=664683 RepID=A0AAP9NLA2_9GAMM|nr:MULTISPECIES: hypothetical protein [Halomonas]QKS24210.1 hypothetical protein FX987_01984 [Halomonas titanicae]CDG54546.1 exported hypothetical protein [Halomonas sp. A3H3]SDI30817.1 hypothetical protein SAMN04487867_104204 [Halomonas titanicae]
MPTLKPIDHQNIVLRLLGMSSSSPAHLTALAHSYKLPVSLHEIRVACDALVEQEFVERAPGYAYRLTAFGTVELPAVPLIESYYTMPRQRTEPKVGDSVWRAAEQAGKQLPGAGWAES